MGQGKKGEPSGSKSLLLGWLVLGLALFWGMGCATVRKKENLRFYPPPPQPPKVQFLKAIYTSEDVESRSQFESFIVGSIAPRKLVKPYGVEVFDGIIYLCEPRVGTVLTIDLAKKTFDTIHDEGSAKLRRPVNLAIDKDGTKYVADLALDKVMVYDHDNRFIRALGNRDEFHPVDVAVSEDRLYVLDIRDNEVEILDKATGEQLGVFGEPGDGEGQLALPTNLTLDEDENVYVTSTVTCKVEKFDPDGAYLMTFGQCGDSIGDFVRPKGVAVDHDGFVYVVDAAFENVQIFRNDGKTALFFGGPGGPDVPGALWLPASVTVSYDEKTLNYFRSFYHRDFEVKYLILVTSQFGPPHLSIYAFGDPKEGTPLARGDIKAYEEKEKPEAGNLPTSEEVKDKKK